jgi:carboxyl-terminal processing protease
MNFTSHRSIYAFLAASLSIAAAGCVSQAQSAGRQPTENLDGSPRIVSASGGAPRADGNPLEGLSLPGVEAKDAKTDNEKISRMISILLTRAHYSRQPLDDAMANRFMDRLLESLDPRHVYFTKADLDEFAPYRTSLDDLTKKGDTSPAEAIFGRFKERVAAQVAYAEETLAKEKFDFSADETFQIDRKQAQAPANLDEAKKLWRSQLRYEYLAEKLNGQKPEEIVKTLTRRYSRLGRTIKDWDQYDVIERYLNGLCNAYDPHTGYFGAARTEDFNTNEMRLSLFGIGATLTSEDGYATVVELVPGGPAFRGKELQAGDKVAAVAQGDDGEFVDAVDMKLNKVVEMIRGPKGTVVRLKVIPANSPDPATRKTIRIVRDEVKLEEQAAKGRIIESPDGKGGVTRVGVLQLPGFYGGENRSASGDMAKILKKFEEAKVSGVILDLRGNRGGLLPEAVSVAGLFLKEGPIVQVKDYAGNIKTESDKDATVAYDGPLVVLTDQMSASASEIVAGALQDYGRAVVIGDPSTFGKGTVQIVLPLGQVMRQQSLATEEDPGSLHLTIQKFYRASGGSTQLKGVVPDILVPTLYGELGEKYEEGPLPWDTVDPAQFVKTNRVTPYLATLKQKSAARTANDADFKYLQSLAERSRKAVADKSVSLNESKRRAEVEAAKKRVAERRKVLATRGVPNEKIYVISTTDAGKPGLPKAMTPKELAEANKKPARPGAEPEENAPEVPEVDVVLNESRRVLQDYIGLSRK